MVSGINYTSIDETYPIAGQDNDSEGFRQNFRYIKIGLTTAASEISDLQSNTAKTNAATNFNFQQISQAAFIDCGDVIYNPQRPVTSDPADSLATILYTNGSFQVFQVSGAVTFTLASFPPNPTNPLNNTSVVSKMRVHLTSSDDGTGNVVTFATTGGTIKMSPTTQALFSSVTCTATTASTDYITCTGANTLTENMPIVFSGTPGGGIVAGTIYFVKVINSSTQFSISESIVSGAAGPVKQLTDTTGLSMTGTTKIGVTHSSNPMVFDFWTYDGGATVFMDYLGIFS